MKKIFHNTCILSFLLILGVLLSPSYSSAHSLDFFTPSTPVTGNTLYGVTYYNGLFVAVGNVGTILTSSDGENWTTRTSGTSNWLNGIIHDGSSRFVAVGGYGTIRTSTNGTSWNIETAPDTHHLNGIAFGNNTFVAVGVLGTIHTRPAGQNQIWTKRTSGTSHYLQGITYANSTFVAVGGSGTILTSPDGSAWTPRTSTTTSYLQAVAYGNNTFVAVGADGTVVTSPDGITWTERTSGTTNELLGVNYGDGIFVAVGVLGTILTSSDGITWTPRLPETSARLYGITHGNNIFVIVGESGTILTASGAIVINSGAPYSTSASVTLTLSCHDTNGSACYQMQFSNDNATWSPSEAYATSKAWTLPSGDGIKTVYVKFQGHSGGSWTDVFSDSIFLDTAAPITTAFPIGGIYYDPYIYVSLPCDDASGSGCDKIYYTTDGSTPTTSSPVYYIPVRLTSATPTIKYFAVDKAGLQESVKTQTYIFDPPPVITTTSLASGILGVSYSDTLIAASGFPPYSWSIVSGSFPGGLSLNSTTGEISGTPTITGTFNFTAQVTDTWPTSVTKPLAITIEDTLPVTGNTLYGVTYHNGLFVAVGEVGTILTSSDGENWSPRISGTPNWLYGITYGNSKFVAVGGYGTILTSSNGTSWSKVDPSPTSYHLYGAAFGNNTFVAVGYNGTILTSSNAQNWNTIAPVTTHVLQGITYANSIFVGVGGSGTIITSPDGSAWTTRTSTTASYLEAVAYGSNTFVAVGASGTIVTSPDGITWTERTSGTTNELLGVDYGDGIFVAVGVLGTILTSSDGITWTPRLPETSARLYGITHGNNIFVIVGESGTILTASGAIVINSGAPYATSASVTLTLSCHHTNGNACDGSDNMQFSDDNVTWSSPEAFNNSRAWTLPSGDGSKTVYVKFEIASSWTDVFSDSIFLDTNAPTTTAFPIGGIYFDPYIYVTLSCSDGTGSGCDKIYYTTDGSTPTTSSSVYSVPVRLTSATPTIKYFAVDKAGNLEASIKTETYVFDPPLTITTTSLASGSLGLPYSETLVATGGFPPYSWAIVSGSFPGGLSLNSASGMISGTPTVSGTFNFTAQVTDDFHPHNTFTKALSIIIEGAPPPPTQYTLTVSKSGTGSGTVTSSPSGIDCGSTCSAAYNSGTSVILTATADSGLVFTGWSGGGCTGTGQCTVAMSAATAVTASFDPTPPGSYSYKKCINGNTTATGANVSSTQSDFPVAVHICANCTGPNFDATEKAHFFGSWNVSGKRVQFFASDQTTILPYEVEYYNATPGSEEAIYWVKVPTIAGNNANSNMVCVAYGNDPNSSNQDNKAGVWDSNFKLVQHLGDNSWGTSPEAKDSTSNANNGTNASSTDAAGQARRGRNFNGSSQYISLPNNFNSLSEGTISAFWNGSVADADGIAASSGTTGNFLLFRPDGSNKRLRIHINNANSTVLYATTPVNSLLTSTTYHVVFTVSTSGNKMFINGAEQTLTYSNGNSSTQAFFNTAAATQTNINRFYYAGSYYSRFNGWMDEVRISSTARSADYIKLEYYSMKKTYWNGDSWITWNSEI